MITPFQNQRGGAGNTDKLNSQSSCRRDSREDAKSLQVAADRMDVFNRLQRAFNAAGWNLHYLDGESCLAVHRRWQMSQVCQDMRAASALLRRIGGAA